MSYKPVQRSLPKLGLISTLLLVSGLVQASPITFTESFGGFFSQTGNNFPFQPGNTYSYTLYGGDGALPLFTSTINAYACGAFYGCASGTFVRDAGNGNTFFGSYSNFVFNDVHALVGEVFNAYSATYGDLKITGGTGMFAGYTGIGHFTGTDLFFALAPTVLKKDCLKCDLFEYKGTSTQDFYWDLNNTSVTQTPVPAAVWLFSSGLAGLMGMRRRFLS